jgi:NitT/TauT family transport system substrate-binding protein
MSGNNLPDSLPKALVFHGLNGLNFLTGLNRFKCLLALFLIVTLARPDCSDSQVLEKVKIGLPDFSISFLPFHLAQSQGFFRAEGLEVELIRISIPVSMVALMNKEIDYAAPTGSVLASGVRGLPLKVIMYSLRTPLHALMVKPEIKSVVELKGRVIGIASGTTEAILRAILAHGKMALEKDVKFTLITESSNRLGALSAGRMDGAVLPPPFSVQGEKMGFRRLISAGEVPEIVEGKIAFPPPTGLGVHGDKLQSQPQQIKQMVRAVLKSHDFIRTRKNETIKIVSNWLKVDNAIATGSYDAFYSSMSPEGWVPEPFMEAVVEQLGQSLKISEKVPAARVVDFRIVRDILGESRKTP